MSLLPAQEMIRRALWRDEQDTGTRHRFLPRARGDSCKLHRGSWPGGGVSIYLGTNSELLLCRANSRFSHRPQVLETSPSINPATLAFSNAPRGGENLASTISGDLDSLGIR